MRSLEDTGDRNAARPDEVTMKTTLFRVILPVTDIEHAAGFYGAILGQAGQRVSAGRHYFDCGGTILACFDPAADGDGYAPTSIPEWIYLAVDDLEGAFAACRTADATFSEEDVHGSPAGQIRRRPWGERSFYVLDPFGNKLCFVDETTKFTGS